MSTLRCPVCDRTVEADAEHPVTRCTITSHRVVGRRHISSSRISPICYHCADTDEHRHQVTPKLTEVRMIPIDGGQRRIEVVGMQSWSKIRDALGFKSIGAVQQAYKRYNERNPLPNAEAARAEIIERKRVTVGAALKSLADAQKAGDHQTVARMIDVITRADAELAKLYGLSRETVDVNVSTTATRIIAEARERLLAVVDAEVIEPKELDQ